MRDPLLIDLPTRIVDIIFADDLVPGEFEQPGQRVADHRPTAMAHVHRARRIGRDVLDIDRLARTDHRAAVIAALADDRIQFFAPHRVVEAQVDESRPGDLDARNIR